jgi:glycosyltransferase involved in cell wall biosynthesis
MKIAVVHPHFRTRAGAENVVYWLCEDLATKHGMKITVFSLDFGAYESRFKSIPDLELKKILVPRLFQRLNALIWISAVIFLKRNLRGYDVINPHNYPASLWVGMANILSMNRLPKIVWSCNEPAKFLYHKICYEHTPKNLQVTFSDLDDNLQIRMASRVKFVLKNLYKPILRWLDRRGVRTFYRILPISETCRDQVRQIYGVNNAFTCDLGIKGFVAAKRLHDNEEGNYFLTVSRLEGYKNIPSTIEAVALLKQRNKLNGLHYYIIGTGPMESYLKKIIKNKNLEQDVTLLGFVTKEQLIDYYQKCMFIIHLPYDETFGLAYLEAAAFSKPAVASNHAGPAEIVIDGQTGFLADPADIEDVARKMELMCASIDTRILMGKNAFIRLNQKFLWDTYIEHFVGHLTT